MIERPFFRFCYSVAASQRGYSLMLMTFVSV
jgi:hypothetical protein